MKNNRNKIFHNLKKGDKVKYEYWYDEIKKGENTATVEELYEDEVWLSDSRHEKGSIWIKTKDRIKERTKDGDTDYDIYIKDVSISDERIKELEEKTYLSNREAELYILTEQLNFNVPKASEKMDISKNNAYGKRGDIKEKIQKAEKTAELNI